MSNLISKKVRGFRDILPAESMKFLHIENIIHRITPLFNVQQIRLPALESVELFKRSIGETSDIVTKEMYSFEDRNNYILFNRNMIQMQIGNNCCFVLKLPFWARWIFLQK